MIATIAHKLIPFSDTLPTSTNILPIPNVMTTEIMHKLRASVTSTLPRIKVLMPTTAIEPKTSIIIPPITIVGIVDRNAPTFPQNEIAIAQTAAQVIILGLKFRVNITAPVTSA